MCCIWHYGFCVLLLCSCDQTNYPCTVVWTKALFRFLVQYILRNLHHHLHYVSKVPHHPPVLLQWRHKQEVGCMSKLLSAKTGSNCTCVTCRHTFAWDYYSSYICQVKMVRCRCTAMVTTASSKQRKHIPAAVHNITVILKCTRYKTNMSLTEFCVFWIHLTSLFFSVWGSCIHTVSIIPKLDMSSFTSQKPQTWSFYLLILHMIHLSIYIYINLDS